MSITSRPGAIGSIRLSALAAIIILLPTAAQASMTKGPYLQNVTDTSIVVRWETSAAGGGSVEYGLTGNYGSHTDQTGSSTQHEIALSALLPDTLYYYRAISGADTSAGATLHTSVASRRPFRFFAFGDNRSNTADHQRVINQMLQVPGTLPGFVLNSGDLTASGSSADYQTFFNVEDPLLGHTPIYPCLGNHDTGNIANYTTYFSLPNNERWYSFRDGNSAFHVLDLYSTYTPGSAQYDWFLNELRADSADARIRHIFVTFHEPPYTTNTGHASNMTVRQYICPLLERFKVGVTFQGHVHCYEHSLVNGVHYLITGGGGAPLYNTWGAAQPWTVYREACLEFVQVDVRGDTLDVKAIKVGGTVIDSFRLIEEPSAVPGEPGRTLRAARLVVKPNPASRIVHMSFTLPHQEHATLSVHNSTGARIAVLVDSELPATAQMLDYPTRRLPAGVYFAVLRTAEDRRVARFVVVR